jgi:hypothetical protein
MQTYSHLAVKRRTLNKNMPSERPPKQEHKTENNHKQAEVRPELQKILTLSKSTKGLPAVEVVDASPQMQAVIRRVIKSNIMDDPDYKIRNTVGAYLQGDSEGWILVEFWKGTDEQQQAFVDYLNKEIAES